MRVDDFDFDLPDELVAQEPPAERGASRLLMLDRRSGALRDSMFHALPDALHRGDLLVLNDTRVYPARLLGHRVPSMGAVECLLLQEIPEAGSPDRESRRSADRVQPTPGIGTSSSWEALVHPGQKLQPGARMLFAGAGLRLHGEVLARHFHGRRTVRLWTDDGTEVADAIDRLGHIPLPPYIRRDDRVSDRERYQTVYAHERGSIAAPTAGLHFTTEMLRRLEARGVELSTITLHVGYGTFKPVRTEHVEAHVVDREAFHVSAHAAAALTRARKDGRRVIAVGTTTTRALESLRLNGDGEVVPASGSTELFIRPGHDFVIVRGLITNFHLPRSSLLMLVAAFAGRERVLAAYRHAVERRYRFYSYGDAMLVI